MHENLSIVTVYNRYLNRGGEDEVFESEARLLREKGCRVIEVEETVEAPRGILHRAKLAVDAVWSRDWHRKFLALLERERPDVVHVHNTFPIISPSIFHACQTAGVPVVATLHNYRLVCPKAILYRDGRPCNDCVGKTLAWPGIQHACYHDSRAETAVIAATTAIHAGLGTWSEKVTLYIALTDFAREKFVAGGLPAEKIVVKPNFVHPATAIGTGRGNYALFVGRLSEQKGTHTLLAAWRELGATLPLKIAGDGPIQPGTMPGVEWLGRVPRERVVELMQDATVLIFPSVWYETFGMSIIEAFAVGLPVVASDLGAAAALVENGRTGRLFRAGDAGDLAAHIRWALEHRSEWAQMRLRARAEYESKYTAERNYGILAGIYARAMKRN